MKRDIDLEIKLANGKAKEFKVVLTFDDGLIPVVAQMNTIDGWIAVRQRQEQDEDYESAASSTKIINYLMKPQRIQRKRTKGWRMPEKTVSVCRPGKWGNPYRVVTNSIQYYDRYMKAWRYYGHSDDEEELSKMVVELFRHYMEGKSPANIGSPPDTSELRGKNLACFCKIGQPCHADVLLEIANSEER